MYPCRSVLHSVVELSSLSALIRPQLCRGVRKDWKLFYSIECTLNMWGFCNLKFFLNRTET